MPFCYGVYEFKIPGGFKVKGMVMEDLSNSKLRSIPRVRCLTKPQDSGERLYEQWINRLVSNPETLRVNTHSCTC